MASPNSALVVPPSLGSNATDSFLTNDIRPIKPPVEIPSGWAWLWWTLALLALAAGAWWLWRWRRRRLAAQAVVPVIPPHVRAKQRLEQALLHLADTKLFVTLISDALRVYLEERFQLRAPERTTEEFLTDLQTTQHLDTAQKLTLADFLQRCDLVKFAQFEPTEAALRDLYEVASRLVDETRYDPILPEAPPQDESPAEPDQTPGGDETNPPPPPAAPAAPAAPAPVPSRAP